MLISNFFLFLFSSFHLHPPLLSLFFWIGLRLCFKYPTMVKTCPNFFPLSLLPNPPKSPYFNPLCYAECLSYEDRRNTYNNTHAEVEMKVRVRYRESESKEEEKKRRFCIETNFLHPISVYRAERLKGKKRVDDDDGNKENKGVCVCASSR